MKLTSISIQGKPNLIFTYTIQTFVPNDESVIKEAITEI
jgi:hypothetical protein